MESTLELLDPSSAYFEFPVSIVVPFPTIKDHTILIPTSNPTVKLLISKTITIPTF